MNVAQELINGCLLVTTKTEETEVRVAQVLYINLANAITQIVLGGLTQKHAKLRCKSRSFLIISTTSWWFLFRRRGITKNSSEWLVSFRAEGAKRERFVQHAGIANRDMIPHFQRTN